MKILFLDWACFNKDDTLNAFERMGHEVIRFFAEGHNDLVNEVFLSSLKKCLEDNNPDMAFSYNYFPLMAQGCKDTNVPYISFMYDSPYTYIYSYTLAYPTNHVFLFDRSWVNEFIVGGLTNVHYMVLPGNADRVEGVNAKYYDPSRTRCDVSFVGSLYNEKHNFYERLEKNADKYLIGYLEGVMEAQQKLYGMSVVEPLLTDEIIDRMKAALTVEEDPMGVEPKGYRYSNYFVKRKITQIERNKFLTSIGKTFGKEYDVRLFTVDESVAFDGIRNMGVAVYENEMPYVFRDSRINLNISLRSINTGIPLRCVDIMSCGGFLLSNYQADLVTDFIPGEDFEYYSDPEDMLSKIEYYLTHENERAEIAQNGHEKIRKYYSYEAVFGRIFDIVFGESDG